MNIGIYVNSLSDEKQLKLGIETIENGISENIIDDASVFYDAISFSPLFFPCGVFNSTDLWNFSGKLITFSLDCLDTVTKVVNKIDVYYCYGYEKQCNLLKMLDLLNGDIKVICNSEEDQKKFYRLTGVQSLGSLENDKLLNMIGD